MSLYERAASVVVGSGFPEPRAFQVRAHNALRTGFKAGHRCQLLMAPTGAGKTYLGLRACHEAIQKGRRALFVCDRITLINQTSATADRYGMSDHGVIQGSHWRFKPQAPLQIASADTLESRGIWPEADVVVIDECHTQKKVWTEYIPHTKAAVIGLSATPFSPGLGKLFTNLVNAATMRELTELGVLTPMRVFSCTRADMAGAATRGGEWTERAAEERGMAILGDVVSEWIKYGQGRKTICFGATIKHCEEIARRFSESGVMAAVFTAHTTPGEREALLKEYRRPDSTLRVLVSVEALAKGFDVPDVGCVIDCRPLRKSLSTAIQMWGRGLRASPDTGKADCILLDHSGNIIRFAEDFEEIYHNGLAELDAGVKLDKSIRRDEDEQEIVACPSCGFKPFKRRCVSCGFQPQSAALMEHQPGVMQEIRIGGKKAANDSLHLWHQCVQYARENSKPEKRVMRAAFIYRDIVGQMPPAAWRATFDEAPHVTVKMAVRRQIAERNKAWRAKQASAAL